MPKFDIPSEENDSMNSSHSFSSHGNGSVSNRSMASSASSEMNNNPPHLMNGRSKHIYSPFNTNFQLVCRAPTLDVVLVDFLLNHFQKSFS